MTTTVQLPSPNHSPRKAGVRVDTVLLHHTGTDRAGRWSNGSALHTLRNPSSGVSAHYVVGTLGNVWQLVDERRKAWHAGKGRLPWETCPEYDFNHRSVGIELVNPGDGRTPFTEAQYQALAWLVPGVVKRLGWGATYLAAFQERCPVVPAGVLLGCVLGHRDVAPGRKTDPADNFDWSRVRAALAGVDHG